jgi:hypothetical protein
MAALTLPAELQRRDKERRAGYARHLAFYGGAQWASPTRAERRRRRLTINYVKPIIHKVTAALLKGMAVTVPPVDESDEALRRADEVEVALAQVAEQNGLEELDFDTEVDAAVLGDGVFKVWWDTDFEMVRVSAPDPAGVWAWTFADDPSRTWRVATQYKLEAEAARETLGLSGAGLRALEDRRANRITEDWTVATYERWVNDVRETAGPNPYGVIPFVVFPNIREPKQQWGESDVTALRQAQEELNRTLTQLSLIMELSGNPIAVLEGVTEAQDIAVEPGELWTLPEKAKAYLLDLLGKGGAGLHMDYLEAVYRALFDVGETPRTAFGGASANISGVALELDLDPLVKKVNRKRILRARAYRERSGLILSMLDQFTGTAFGEVSTGVSWGSVLPTDRDREVDNEVAMVGAGIHSRRHAADELGAVADPDAEFDRWEEEQRRVTAAGGAATAPAPPRE